MNMNYAAIKSYTVSPSLQMTPCEFPLRLAESYSQNILVHMLCRRKCRGAAQHDFFLEEDSCVPVFELVLSMAEGDLLCSIDPYALVNALYIQHPDYAVSNNAVEQARIHLGGIVSFTPENGTEYIVF